MRTPLPRLSFVVPVFNAGAWLRRCLGSLLVQRGVTLEVIAVDDGSTDGSPEILERAAAAAPEVVRFFSRGHSGAGSSRNFGVSQARGEFVWFVDADDVVPYGAADRLVGVMDDSGADAVCFRNFPSRKPELALMIPFLRPSWRGRPAWRFISPERAVLDFGPVPWGKVWRRDFLLRAEVRYPDFFGEDNVETPRLVLAASSIVAVERKFYIRRIGHMGRSGTGGVSADAAREVDVMFAAFDEMAAAQDGRFRDVLDLAAAKTAAYMEKVGVAAVSGSLGDRHNAEILIGKSRSRLAALLARSEAVREATGAWRDNERMRRRENGGRDM